MLNIHYINPTGMFSYGLSDNIVLSENKIIHLKGINFDDGKSSNGSGKSSLFNAICEILWGENLTGVSGDGVINTALNKGFAGQVEFTSWEGKRYRVTYCRKWKNNTHYKSKKYKGSSLFFEVYEEEGLIDFTGASIKDTRERILYALGMDFKKFSSIAYYTSRQGSALLRGTNKDKIDVISGICGLEEWDQILENSRVRKRNDKQEVVLLKQQQQYIQGNIDAQTMQLQYLSYYKDQIKENKDKERKAKDAVKELKKQTKKLKNRITKLTKEQQSSYDEKAYTSLQQQKEQTNRDLYSLQQPVLINKTEDEQKLSIDIQNIADSLNVLKGEIQAKLKKDSLTVGAICPLCNTKISKTKADKIKAELDLLNQTYNESKNLRDKKAALLSDIKNKQQNLFEAQRHEYTQKKDQLISLQQNLEKQQQELLIKTQKYTQLIQEANYLLNLNETQIDAQTTDLTSIHQTIVSLEQEIYKLKTIETSLLQNKQELDLLSEQIQSFTNNITVYDWFIQNIPYIKLHKLSIVLQQLSDLTNVFLEEMGDSIRVKFSSFNEKKNKKEKGDAFDLLKSEINVEIIDGDKIINPKLYSDGEIGRVSTVILCALHKLSQTYGYGCNILLLDELFAYIDKQNAQKIGDLLSQKNTNSVILMTDNSDAIKTMLDFNETWVVEKHDKISTLHVRG